MAPIPLALPTSSSLQAMASLWSLSSFASPPLCLTSPGEPRTRESDGFSRVPCCALGSRTRKAGASSGSPSPTSSSAAGRAAVKAAPPPKKRHWKEGEFPGVSEAGVSKPPRTPIKNVKKKVDDRAAAKAWVSTVTEALAEKMQKKQWQEALEVRYLYYFLLFFPSPFNFFL